MSKLINLGWILSIMAFLGVLLFNYAYLQDPIQVYKAGTESVLVSREGFFYGGLGLFLFVNTVFISFSRILGIKGFFKQTLFKENLLIWFNGLSFIINIFFILTIFFVTALNNAEFINSSRLYVLVYPVVGLMILWFVLLLVLVIKRPKKSE